jgi:hypothetical protein
MNARDDSRNTGDRKTGSGKKVESAGSQNEGEGSRTAAAEYNKGATRTARSGKVEQAAKAAERAYEGSEGEELRRAEAKGRSHAKDEDPQIKRR